MGLVRLVGFVGFVGWCLLDLWGWLGLMGLVGWVKAIVACHACGDHSLSDCNIGEPGARAIASSLQGHPRLTTLG